MTNFECEVYEYLLKIPDGKVVTYGQIANEIGNPGAARAVGNALHKNPQPDKYPCYKVVNNKGKLAKHFALGIEEQKIRLQLSGVEVEDDKVDLNKYGAF